ncbi:MAG TPA: histidinol-phosphate transaminase [Chitinophagaceae bacterium]|nr:histidinol-phosphate transaminase [Chitinophagaceae bacterium]
MSFDLNAIIRPNIRNLVPYSSARDEFKGEASVYLDANENSLGSPLIKWYNRYPDPLQWEVKKKLSAIKGIAPEQIFLGNGSDEAIDLLYRAFCEPGIDNVVICPPTYGMYEVSANINNIKLKKVPLTPEYQLDLEAMEEAIDVNTRIIWLCSPNNPTGNSLDREDVEIILNNFDGLVVVDEAYINFSRHRSFIPDLADYPNLVVLQTLSKAWGLAALRIGMAFASKEIIEVFNRIKPPYNISQAAQDLVLDALDRVDDVNDMIRILVEERKTLAEELAKLPQVIKVYPSDANFLLVKTVDAKGLYKYLVGKGIVVRDRSNVTLCDESLRITVGTPRENQVLLKTIAEFEKS